MITVLAGGVGAARFLCGLVDAISPSDVTVPRNHMVEQALAASPDGDLAPFRDLLAAIGSPYSKELGREAFALPAPSGFGPYKTFCGT